MTVESSNFVIPEDRDEDQVQSPLGGASPTNTTNDLHKPAERNLIGTKLNTESDKNISGISAASSLAAVQRHPEKNSSSS